MNYRIWYEVGEIVKVRDIKLKVIFDGRREPNCNNCYFHENKELICDDVQKEIGSCASNRIDGLNVIFILYEEEK